MFCLPHYCVFYVQTASSDLANLIALVETVVDLPQADKHHKYVIKADFDEELQDLATELEELDRQLHQIHKEMSVSLHLDMEKDLKLDQNIKMGYHFRVVKKVRSLR